MQSKKAVSAVVGTVLIIMITVAAVGVIWAAVIPMVRNSIDKGSACFDAQSDVSLTTDQGYTCINSTTGKINLQVKKGANTKVSLVGIQVLISVNGSTSSEKITTGLPGNNEEKLLATTSNYLGAQKVSIAPIVTIGKTQETCEVSSEIVLTPCT